MRKVAKKVTGTVSQLNSISMKHCKNTAKSKFNVQSLANKCTAKATSLTKDDTVAKEKSTPRTKLVKVETRPFNYHPFVDIISNDSNPVIRIFCIPNQEIFQNPGHATQK